MKGLVTVKFIVDQIMQHVFNITVNTFNIYIGLSWDAINIFDSYNSERGVQYLQKPVSIYEKD